MYIYIYIHRHKYIHILSYIYRREGFLGTGLFFLCAREGGLDISGEAVAFAFVAFPFDVLAEMRQLVEMRPVGDPAERRVCPNGVFVHGRTEKGVGS